MENPDPAFNFTETVNTVFAALNGVVCHIFFDAALHGLLVAAIVALVSLALKPKRENLTKPILVAAGKLAITCAIFTIPGFITLVLTGTLPETGYYNIHSIGFIGFWSLASVWLVGEQINYQRFSDNNKRSKTVIEKQETSSSGSTSKSNT